MAPRAIFIDFCQCYVVYFKKGDNECLTGKKNEPRIASIAIGECGLILIVPSQPEWEAWQIDFSAFDEYAEVEKSPFRQSTFRCLMSIGDVRYPGHFPTETDAEHAMLICDEVRRTVRAMLKLSEEGSTDNVNSAG